MKSQILNFTLAVQIHDDDGCHVGLTYQDAEGSKRIPKTVSINEEEAAFGFVFRWRDDEGKYELRFEGIPPLDLLKKVEFQEFQIKAATLSE